MPSAFVLLGSNPYLCRPFTTTGVVTCCEIETWSASHRPHFKKGKNL